MIRRFLQWLFSWRTARRALIGFVGLITLLALFLTEENWRGKHNWENFKKEMAAKGEKLNIEDLAPPPVPDDQNFAMAPIWRTNLFHRVDQNGGIAMDGSPAPNLTIEALSPEQAPALGNWLQGRRADLLAWQAYYRGTNNLRLPSRPTTGAADPEPLGATFFPIAATPQSPAADVLLALSRNDAPLQELRQATKRPFCRLQTNYEGDLITPSLATLKQCVRFLTLRSKAELASGNSTGALEDVQMQLHLVDMTSAEPFLITHLVRVAMVNITLGSVWEGLADHRWSDQQLEAIEVELGKLDFLADYLHAMRGDRAFSLSMLEENIRTGSPYGGLAQANPLPDFPGRRKLARMLVGGVFYENMVSIGRAHEQWILPSVDLERRLVSLKTPPASALQTGFWPPSTIFMRLLLPAIDKSVVKFARAQSLLDLARVACALERYWQANQKYPDSLDALAPKFIPSIPHDIMDGKPLRYHPTGDGHFVLYSVGWNKTDEGGVSGLKDSGNLNFETGDWLWPLAEVK